MRLLLKNEANWKKSKIYLICSYAHSLLNVSINSDILQFK